MNVTVFTCTFGDTDQVRQPTVVNPDVRYVLLSDRPTECGPYECHIVDVSTNLDAARLESRRVKIMMDHPALGSPDVTLWHDAAFRLDCDPVDVVWDLLEDEMVAFRHPDRDQIEDEAVAIDRWKYLPLGRMLEQCSAYRAEGFRQDTITSTGFCLRMTTPKVRRFCETWWREVERWGWRDQLSVDYSLWKSGLRPKYIEGHYRDNPYATFFNWKGEPMCRRA